MNATAFDAGVHCLKITLYGSGGAALSGHADWVTIDPIKKIGLLFAANFFAAIISYMDAHPIATAFKFIDENGQVQTVQKVVPIDAPVVAQNATGQLSGNSGELTIYPAGKVTISPATTPEGNQQTKTP